MFNWDKAVDSHFDKKTSKKREFEELLESVFGKVKVQLLTEAQDNTEDSQGRFKLPPIKISETWGRLENGDRERLWRFAKNIKGNSLQEKLSYINSVISSSSAGTDVGEILSVMMITEILSNILGDFTQSAGGFIFEAFLAGLFGSDSVQVVDVSEFGGEEGEEGQKGKPITDVVLNGVHYSLKLLADKGSITASGGKSSGTPVKGSFKNMIEHFAQMKEDPYIYYLDARRNGSILTFGQFEVSLDNFLDVFDLPLRKTGKPEFGQITSLEMLRKVIEANADDPLATINFKPSKVPKDTELFLTDPENFFKNYEKVGDKWKPKQPAPLSEDQATKIKLGGDIRIASLVGIPDQILQQLVPALGIKFTATDFEGSKKLKSIFGSNPKEAIAKLRQLFDSGIEKDIINFLRTLPGYLKSEQFEFTQTQVENISSFKELGKLDLNEDKLKQLWINNAQLLEQTIAPVYRAFDRFSNNIENYVTASPSGEGQTRKAYGDQAISSSKQLADATAVAVPQIEKSRKDSQRT
jgi:hypothetical protein